MLVIFISDRGTTLRGTAAGTQPNESVKFSIPRMLSTYLVPKHDPATILSIQ
ncbi:hypothetical protein M404DRAFT_735734 [Pisolithus tinctorius Marx 270]|uniref:Uncharacterized protein n=1 Tax=Pisolithus tinctorius Marx 270 TaxID=870435 RepID=A0A0C3N9V2_PISTI|nr:hypothetical protein M404DRAFT_735734 [Pisolithus tinctorius Marx 270]